jgi:3-oxoacyl-[acyl-carrier protein] reductase
LGKSHLRKVILLPLDTRAAGDQDHLIELGRCKALVASVCRKGTTPLAQRIHLVRLHRLNLRAISRFCPSTANESFRYSWSRPAGLSHNESLLRRKREKAVRHEKELDYSVVYLYKYRSETSLFSTLFIMSKLLGKVAVVTGASKGIGAGIAKALAAEGASVVVNYSTSKQGADRVVDEISKRNGRAVAIQGDVAKAADLERIFAETKRVFGQLDVLVNNAGVYEFAPLEAITEEQFHRQFNTNVLGLILATREAVKYFGERGGSVINIGSVASRQTPPSTCVYTATKGAVDAVTGVLAKELGSKHIRVNSINPGFVETEGVHAAGLIDGDFIQGLVAQTPLGRGGQPEDIAPVAVFLASDDSHWVTGEHVLVSGGLR